MNPGQIVTNSQKKLDSVFAHFEEELKKLRTGRAHPSMLDGITAEAYGQQMPLNQLATITTPEPQLVQLSPFDPGNLQPIVSAIRDNQTLGMNPMDDGHIVRVPIPALTEERRKQIVKQLGQKAEDCMISARNIRHDSLKELDQAKKDKEISEDDHKRLSKDIDAQMSSIKNKVDAASKSKETEILTI